MKQASFEYVEVYHNRKRIQKRLGYLPHPSLSTKLTQEWRRQHNISVHKSGRRSLAESHRGVGLPFACCTTT